MKKIIYIVLLGLIVAIVICIKEPKEKGMTDAEVLNDPRAAAEWSESLSKNKSKTSLYEEAYECLLNKECD